MSSVRLRIKSGPLQGREYPIKEGSVIGRAETEIMINDPKISGRHAKIEILDQNQFALIDLGSTNGIRVNGQRTDKLKLTPGLLFRIGGTDFEVLGEPSAESSTAAPPPLDEFGHSLAQAQRWNDVLVNYSKELSVSGRTPQHSSLPFEPLLVLRVISGLNAGQTWVLGYGPRTVGSKSIDLPLIDPACPDFAFSVTPFNGGCRFQTHYSNLVRLNGNAVSSELLYAGDHIEIGQTVIEVEFKK